MCRSDGLIGLSSTRTSASPRAKGGVGISASFNTLFGSPVSRKINAFINTSWVFRRRMILAGCSTTSGTRSGARDEGEHCPAHRRHAQRVTARAPFRDLSYPVRSGKRNLDLRDVAETNRMQLSLGDPPDALQRAGRAAGQWTGRLR